MSLGAKVHEHLLALAADGDDALFALFCANPPRREEVAFKC